MKIHRRLSREQFLSEGAWCAAIVAAGLIGGVTTSLAAPGVAGTGAASALEPTGVSVTMRHAEQGASIGNTGDTAAGLSVCAILQ